jgi:hypothetical protein
MHTLIHNQLQAQFYKNMVRYSWYAAKLITSCKIFCNANGVAFTAKAKTENVNARSKNLLDAHGIRNFCVLVAFMMSKIRYRASLSL